MFPCLLVSARDFNRVQFSLTGSKEQNRRVGFSELQRADESSKFGAAADMLPFPNCQASLPFFISGLGFGLLSFAPRTVNHLSPTLIRPQMPSSGRGSTDSLNLLVIPFLSAGSLKTFSNLVPELYDWEIVGGQSCSFEGTKLERERSSLLV